jgi:integrase
MHFSTWNVDASQILSRQELAAVLKDVKRRAARLPNVQMNLAIVGLACCCGLRASEIDGLTLATSALVSRARTSWPCRARQA